MKDKNNAIEEIRLLIEKYNKVVKEDRVSKYREEKTKKDFILPLFRALGWAVEESTEITAEEKVSKKRVDYGFSAQFLQQPNDRLPSIWLNAYSPRHCSNFHQPVLRKRPNQNPTSTLTLFASQVTLLKKVTPNNVSGWAAGI